jgi:hypothetical protein
MTAWYTAASDEAQAASVVRFMPPKFSRLAMRPAATLGKMPAKESSVHSGRRAATSFGSVPLKRGSSERRPYCMPKSPAPPLAPMITEARSRSKGRSW